MLQTQGKGGEGRASGSNLAADPKEGGKDSDEAPSANNPSPVESGRTFCCYSVWCPLYVAHQILTTRPIAEVDEDVSLLEISPDRDSADILAAYGSSPVTSPSKPRPTKDSNLAEASGSEPKVADPEMGQRAAGEAGKEVKSNTKDSRGKEAQQSRPNDNPQPSLNRRGPEQLQQECHVDRNVKARLSLNDGEAHMCMELAQ